MADAGETVEAEVETSITVAPLGCLPMDLSGWTRADDRLDDGAALADNVALASNDDIVVATPRLGSGLDVWYSADGLVWETAASTPDVVLGPDGHAVAGGARGFVAVATAGEGELPRTPVVVFSLDGMSWEQIDPVSLPTDEVAWLNDVFAGPEGFLVVGTAADQDLSRFVWSSDDGRTWTETDLPVSPGGSVTVTTTETGWAALTLELAPLEEGEVRSSNEYQRWIADTARVRVWTSVDGHRWTDVETETSPPAVALLSMWTVPFTVVDDVWVLALNGATSDSPEPRSPAVWVSTDHGTTWSEHTVWDEPDQPGFQLHDTAVTEFGLLMAGYQDKPGGPGVEFMHHSQDGTTWQHCWTDPLELQAIEPFGDAIVAATGTGTVYVWNEPNQ